MYGLRVQGHTWQGVGRGRERRKERKEGERKRDDVADGSSRRCWGNVRPLTSAARDMLTKWQNIEEHHFLKNS